MAIDALNNLLNNIPEWQKRLDDLSSQIDKRQTDLAALADASPKKDADVKSLRNRGSTESLKPADDGPVHPTPPEELPEESRKVSMPPHIGQLENHCPPRPAVEARLSLPRPSLEARGLPSSRANVKKRNRTSSIASADGARTTYRTRSMIIVYYDSYVQSFFDELVRFVSASRNLMRKAKMAAKVAQIKRLAELEVDDENTSADDNDSAEALPSLRYISSRRYGSNAMRFGPPGLKNQAPDVYDELDKSLEFVQSTCEHGAHQFLRDARCNEEIKKIQQRLKEVFGMAEKEMDRIRREEPDKAKDSGDNNKARMRRPLSVSRTLATGHKDERLADDVHSKKLEVADPSAPRTPILHVVDRIEADACADDDDFDEEAVLQAIRFRSTRQMRAVAN